MPKALWKFLRSWLAGKAFLLAGWLDESYAVYLDGAPRRSETSPDDLIVWADVNATLDSITPNDTNPIWTGDEGGGDGNLPAIARQVQDEQAMLANWQARLEAERGR